MHLNSVVLAADAEVLCTLNEVMDHLAIPTDVHTEADSLCDAIASSKFDSVVLDMDNPRSVEILRLIRESEQNSRALILAIIGNAAGARAAFEAGANFVLHKPFSPGQASSCLRTGYSRIFANRRRSPRVTVSIPASVAVRQQRFKGTILDLSTGGLAIRCESRLPIGEVVSVAFKLPGDKANINATGTVVWSDVKRTAGLRFTFVPQEEAKRLAFWLKTNG